MAREPNQKVLTKKHLARLEKERIQQRYLLIGIIAVVVLVIGVIVFGILEQTVFQAMRPVAKVGSETITVSEFQKEARFNRFRLIDQLRGITQDVTMLQFFGQYVQQIQSQLASPNLLGQQVLDSMVEDVLIAQEAQKRGITVTDAEVDTAFQEAFGYFPNGTPTSPATPTAYSTSTLSPTQEALFPPTQEPAATVEPTSEAEPTAAAETATPEPSATPADAATPTAEFTPTPAATATITPTPTAYSTQLYEENVQNYVSTVSAVDYSRNDLRDLLRRQLLRQKVYEAITKDVPATAEQIWARHILVATEDEAKQVLDRLNKGENFADLAAELSTDESNKAQGGDLGWFTKGRMVQPFEEAVFNMKVGEISQPVQTNFGFHVIQVLGREERPLDSQQFEEAQQQAYDEWLASAKTAAGVETYDANWTAAVPTDPEIPVDIQAILQQLAGPQQNLPLEQLPQP